MVKVAKFDRKKLNYLFNDKIVETVNEYPAKRLVNVLFPYISDILNCMFYEHKNNFNLLFVYLLNNNNMYFLNLLVNVSWPRLKFSFIIISSELSFESYRFDATNIKPLPA